MRTAGPHDRQRALGVHRVVDPAGVLPQAARRLDADPAIRPDEVRIAVQRLNLDAASFRQLSEAHGGDGTAVRAAVLDIVGARGKMQNPVTGLCILPRSATIPRTSARTAAPAPW